MGGTNRPAKLGPHFDLSDVKGQLSGYTFRSSVIARAKNLTLATDAQTIVAIRRVVGSLVPADFYRAHTEAYGGRGAVRIDAYAKIDEFGLWFIKFDIEEELVLHSCHESKHDQLVLHNGTILRKP